MKKLSILIITVTFLAISASAQDFNAKLNECLTLANQKEYPKAIEACTVAIKLQPTDNRAYYYRAMVNTYTGTVSSYEAAAVDFKKCLEFNAKDAEVHYLLGVVTSSFKNAKAEKYEQGIKSFTEAIRYNTDKKDVYYRRGEAYRNAADSLTQVVFDKSKEQRDADSKKGDEYYKLALADYQKSLEVYPTDNSALLGLGIAQNSLGQTDLAIATLTKYIEKKPDDKNAYKYRAGAYYSLGKYQFAIKDADKGLELNKTKFTSEREKAETNELLTTLKSESVRRMGATATPSKKSVKSTKKP